MTGSLCAPDPFRARDALFFDGGEIEEEEEEERVVVSICCFSLQEGPGEPLPTTVIIVLRYIIYIIMCS